jgi:hypothetical protein
VARRQQVALIGQYPRACNWSPGTIAALLDQGTHPPSSPGLCSGPCTGPSLGPRPQPPRPRAETPQAMAYVPISPRAAEHVGTQSESQPHTATTPSSALPIYPKPTTAHSQTPAHSLGQLLVSTGGSENVSAKALRSELP